MNIGAIKNKNVLEMEVKVKTVFGEWGFTFGYLPSHEMPPNDAMALMTFNDSLPFPRQVHPHHFRHAVRADGVFYRYFAAK